MRCHAERQDPWLVAGISTNSPDAALTRQKMHVFVPAVDRDAEAAGPDKLPVQVISMMALEPDPTLTICKKHERR